MRVPVRAYMLKTVGLKQFSCPFDWIISSPEMVADCIDSDFAMFLRKDQLFHTVDREGEYCHHRAYGKNTFHHHCPLKNADHMAYFERCVGRWRRLRQEIAAGRANVLYVHVRIGTADDVAFRERVQALHDRLNLAGSQNKCHVLGIQCIENRPRRSCVIMRRSSDDDGDGITLVTMECTSRNEGLSLGDELDNLALRSILSWYDYDLQPLDGGGKDREAYPFASRENNTGWGCCFA